ncbi:MAG TPA: TQO small subunit DoxD [Candidatus Baltobacteraceae bacterium]|nr:TQO small subunit DoxD [Candidatus Baltobacteraceae bacterium]
MRMASHWTYAGWFTVLRLYAGAFWLVHGLPKFLNSSAFMPPSGYMPQAVQKAVMSQTGFYHDFLLNVVTPNVNVFAELVRLGEVLAGCSLILGVFTRFGGLVGCFLALNYMALKGEFSSWTAIGSLDAAAFMLSFLMLVIPAGRVAGVDAVLVRRPAVRKDVIVPEIVDEPPPSTPVDSSSG